MLRRISLSITAMKSEDIRVSIAAHRTLTIVIPYYSRHSVRLHMELLLSGLGGGGCVMTIRNFLTVSGSGTAERVRAALRPIPAPEAWENDMDRDGRWGRQLTRCPKYLGRYGAI